MTSDEIEAVLRAATADTSPLRERIAALERALAYYADPDEYLHRGLRGEIGPRVLTDGGGIARAALPGWESIEAAAPADQS